MANGPTGTWIDLISKAVIQVGFPTVMAGVLLWWLLTSFEKSMELATSRMQSNTEAITRLVANEEAILKELQSQRQEMAIQTQYLKDLTDKTSRMLQLREGK